MNTPLIYIVKSAFYLAAFYLVYTTLSRDTLYTRNRIFILFSIIASLLLPLITIETSRPLNIFFGKTLSEVLISASGPVSVSDLTDNRGSGISDRLLIIYLIGLAIFSLKLLIDLLELAYLIIKNRHSGNHIIKLHGLRTSGFSALGLIFIKSDLHEEEMPEIIRHEQNHLDHYHFLDILLVEIVKVVQWFNPFVHLFNRSLRAVHEYQADEGCLQKGIPVISYQNLLINQVFRSKAFSITNSFSNPTLIKKRMIMMTKKRSGTLVNLKLLMVLPVVAIVMIAFSSCKDKPAGSGNTTEEIAPPPPPPPPPAEGERKVVVNNGAPIPADAPPPPPPPPPPYTVKDGDTTWIMPDKMPLYKGGEAALMKYLADNTNYPDSAKVKRIQGRVTLQFTVGPDGKTGGERIIRGVDPDLDAEALRVLRTLPDFESPGYKNNKPVSVYYNIPIVFMLK